MKRINTKTITVTAILIALSMVWIVFVPTFDLGLIWSFTLFSHLFIFIALLVGPVPALLTTIGSFLGFVLKGANYVVLLRAGSHIFFVVLAIFLLRILDIKKPVHFIIYAVSTAILHGLMETASVYLALHLDWAVSSDSAAYIWGSACGATMLHSIVDCTAAYFIGKLLVHTNLVPLPPLMPHTQHQ